MNYTTILKKGEGLALWIYKNTRNKFTKVFSKLKNRFPVLSKYPLLKYSLIPLFIALFILLRYILKLGINELAIWSSSFVGESSGFIVPERAIVLTIAAAIIMLRIGLRIRSQKKKKTNKMELNYETTK